MIAIGIEGFEVNYTNIFQKKGSINDYTTWYHHGQNGYSDNDAIDEGNENCKNIHQIEMFDLIEEDFAQDLNEEAQKFLIW